MTVGETSAELLTHHQPIRDETSRVDTEEELNVEIVQNSQTSSTNNNNILAQSKPARMGRRKQIAPQKAAGTEGKNNVLRSYSITSISKVQCFMKKIT